MHLNTAPYLLPEDRPEFERALNEALRTTADGPGAELLRTMALSAMSAIAACADTEYQAFVSCREAERRSGGPSAMTAEGPSVRANALGAGVTAMASVLLPVLAGTAAVIFLLLGYLLRVVTPEPAVAAPMRGVGWAFAALAVAGTVLAMTGLWITALRNGSASRRDTPADGSDLASGADQARAAWRQALLERGIVPFLAEACADPRGVQQAPLSHVPPAGGARTAPRTWSEGAQRFRPPRLGYSRPEFSSRASSGPDEAPSGPEKKRSD